MSDAVLDLITAPRIATERRDDGSILLRSAEQLGDHAEERVTASR